MITAVEARKISDSYNAKDIVCREIEKSAKEGDYYTMVPGKLSNSLQNVLINNGFTLEEIKVENGPFSYLTRIQWKI